MTVVGFLRRLLPSVGEHREVEGVTRRLLVDMLPRRYVAPEAPRRTLPRYLEKNAFSLLFLALYRALGVPRERRLFYGLVNHAVRGLVTATDNLLDDEYKELLELRLPARATRFKSVLHLLLFDRFLFRAAAEAQAAGLLGAGQADEVLRRLFHALSAIGEEEAQEEGGVGEILTPRAVIDQVHVHKGGNLLRLALVAPRVVETGTAEALALADRGVFRLGLALQVIDDVTDLHDDVRDRHHNYLVSVVHHEGGADERARLDALFAPGACERLPVQQLFPHSAARTLERAVGEALEGFALLHRAGFWLDEGGARSFVHRLFQLRGAGALWALLPAGGGRGAALSEGAAAGPWKEGFLDEEEP